MKARVPEAVSRWYATLALRERRLVVAGGTLAALLLLFLGVIQPLATAHNRLAAKVRNERTLLNWLDEAQARLQAAGPAAASLGHLPPGQSVFAAVSSAAQSGPVAGAVQRVEQAADGGARLTVKAAAFDDLVHWLGDLARSDGITVVQATIQQAESPGTVDATLTLNAGK